MVITNFLKKILINTSYVSIVCEFLKGYNVSCKIF